MQITRGKKLLYFQILWGENIVFQKLQCTRNFLISPASYRFPLESRRPLLTYPIESNFTNFISKSAPLYGNTFSKLPVIDCVLLKKLVLPERKENFFEKIVSENKFSCDLGLSMLLQSQAKLFHIYLFTYLISMLLSVTSQHSPIFEPK